MKSFASILALFLSLATVDAASDISTTIQTSLNAGSTVSPALTLNAVRDLTLNGTLGSTVGAMPLALTAGRAISSTATLGGGSNFQ